MKKRRKFFCLLLCLMMVFSQMGFAFAETDLHPAENADAGETQSEQGVISEDEALQEPTQENTEKSAEEMLETANSLAEANLPRILTHAMMRMVYEGQQAVKMADAFDGSTSAWKTDIVTGEGEETTTASGDSFSYYAIEDAADWQAFAACVNAGRVKLLWSFLLTSSNVFLTVQDIPAFP